MLKSLTRSATVLLATAAAFGIGFAAAASAKAATITETFTFPTVDGYTTETGSSFSAFDPAFGTLDSVTYNVTATAVFSGGGDTDHNLAQYILMFVGPGGVFGREIRCSDNRERDRPGCAIRIHSWRSVYSGLFRPRLGHANRNG
jgi:ABC-type transport system substrate-binding protein